MTAAAIKSIGDARGASFESDAQRKRWKTFRRWIILENIFSDNKFLLLNQNCFHIFRRSVENFETPWRLLWNLIMFSLRFVSSKENMCFSVTNPPSYRHFFLLFLSTLSPLYKDEVKSFSNHEILKDEREWVDERKEKKNSLKSKYFDRGEKF